MALAPPVAAVTCPIYTGSYKTSSSQRIFANPSGIPKTYTLQPKTNLEDFQPQPETSTSTDDDEEYPADFVHL
ncbi:hypothetical protein AVEN_34648-1 [Araneus ventricosus]|uniref:Uncharacterized protein n=1 Tax=Araneus ventricosus TaxID=182803 RepID=A0A4Y2B0W4_ARAVE|nr:hypothetical protein AVEN_34648-1 [Araneus ventricosus]